MLRLSLAVSALSGVLARPNCHAVDKETNEALPLPDYCCDEFHNPVKEFAQTSACNPDWTQKEASCQITFGSPGLCHNCMVFLPGTNKWDKVFSKTELYEKCDKCAKDCVTEAKADRECGIYVDDYLAEQFPTGAPEEILCTSGHLEGHLKDDEYPLEMKRVLYKAPTLRADDDMHQPSDWVIKGIK